MSIDSSFEFSFFFFQAEDGIRDRDVTGVQTCALPIWFTDPRIADTHQLPDRFFTKDQGAFDKGHLVRREDVAWGDTYEELRFANGDTFHTTNCSPQVAGFNRPGSVDNWGDLEKIVYAQADTERLCLFAGSVLDERDRTFIGLDDEGRVS